MPAERSMTEVSFDEARRGTDEFYAERGGFRYSDEQVDRWLERWFFRYVTLARAPRILDLCCGDGCWSLGILRRVPDANVIGLDVSEGGTAMGNARAAKLALADRVRFAAHDCEKPLPVEDASIDLIFARGLFIYNQHDMMHEGARVLLEHWHDKLVPQGRFVAMYGSKPELMGRYTPPAQTVGLPLNLAPRHSSALHFEGGKFNHTVASFTEPFRVLRNAEIELVHFESGRHTVVTKARPFAREDPQSVV